jgi:hypothetical protein
MLALLIVWLFGLGFIGILVGTFALIYRSLEMFIEVSVIVAFSWSCIYWLTVLFLSFILFV